MYCSSRLFTLPKSVKLELADNSKPSEGRGEQPQECQTTILSWEEMVRRTRPCWPQANGKAERFIRTALNEWAYAETYGHAWKRTACLPIWMHRYNFLRPHSTLAENLQLRRYAATCCHSILISIHLISGSAVRPLVCTKSQLYANSRRTRRSWPCACFATATGISVLVSRLDSFFSAYFCALLSGSCARILILLKKLPNLSYIQSCYSVRFVRITMGS